MAFTPQTIRTDNICMIWVDDMIDVFTWREAFGVTIQTPNIDRLMARGARFANAYATVPLCAPCRAEMATGLSPFRTGLVDLNRFWRDVLPPERAWAYDLRAAGFYNFTTGKVDSNYKPMPEAYRRVLFHEEPEASDRGGRKKVKEYLGGRGPGICGINHPDDDGSQDDRFYDYWVAQNAIDHLRRADPNRRHLIQLGFKHPHMNLDCPDRFYQMYDPAKITWPANAAPEDFFGPQNGFPVYDAAYIANGNWTPEKAGDEGWRQVVRAYFAACSHVDHEIGRFLSALEASPLGDKTTVIFLSDNGFNLGTHDSFHKMSQWDSAAHVPLGIWSPRMEEGQVIDLPVSLHNLPSTIMELAGLPRRADWVSGQSLLPLIDASFGSYDRSKSPVTAVFGTLSVRPSVPELSRYRYFRYPNGEEHVYDLILDPGETTNLAATAPIEALRDELWRGAAELGLTLHGLNSYAGIAPTHGASAELPTDPLPTAPAPTAAGGPKHFWAYGSAAEALPQPDAVETLWYLGGPDDYRLSLPEGVGTVRIGTVVARTEASVPRTGKAFDLSADPATPLTFESSERVSVRVSGSRQGDRMTGPRYGQTVFYGREGDDLLIAQGKRAKERAELYGGSGNDTLIGGPGNDTLDGGSGDDLIYGGSGANLILAGPGNDIIEDGEGASRIHTGPGRNRLTLAEGAHRVFVGPGPNRISSGPGAKLFVLDYGAAVDLSGWDRAQVYDLSRWPGPPQQRRLKDGSVLLWHGVSCLRLRDIPPKAEALSQCRLAEVSVSGWQRPPPADAAPPAEAAPKRRRRRRAAQEGEAEES